MLPARRNTGGHGWRSVGKVSLFPLVMLYLGGAFAFACSFGCAEASVLENPSWGQNSVLHPHIAIARYAIGKDRCPVFVQYLAPRAKFVTYHAKRNS